MMHFHNPTEKRNLVTTVAKDHLLGDSRLAHDLSHGRDYTYLIQEYQIPVLHRCSELAGEGSFNMNDLSGIRRVVAKLCHELDVDDFPPVVNLTMPTPVEMVGYNAPSVARRAGVTLSPNTIQTCEIMSSTMWKLDIQFFEEVILPYRDTLDPREGQPEFLHDIYVAEIRRLGDSLFCNTYSRVDEQTRKYPHNCRGFSFQYSKVLRSGWRFGEAIRISDADVTFMHTWLCEKHGVSNFEAVARRIKANPLDFMLTSGGNYEMAGDAYAFLQARDTGFTDWMYELDAAASGITHILAMDNHPLLDQLSNINNPNWVAPKELYWVAIRNAAVHLCRNLSYDEMKEVISGSFSPCMYGGTHIAVAGELMGLAYDSEARQFGLGTEEHPKTPKVPACMANHFASCGSNEEIIEKMVRFAKKFSFAFNQAFPFLRQINKREALIWEQHFKDHGVPPAVIDAQYVNQPSCVRFDKTRTDRVKVAFKDASGKRMDTTHTVFRATPNASGTPHLVKKAQRSDAGVAEFTIIDLDGQDIPCGAVHDAFFVRFPQRHAVNPAYRRGFGTWHNITLPAGWRNLRA